ncbi:hypothetical protein NLX86_26135 [Streptomyces sp. A3M-1-3]|uniref:hypothetical protein n=1 Tax=Streptomyces sp. A3M-1-3 TaxID=2962044 RepID=UPI0020B858C9|nr:hypothetical protein [Streptomyces sp. A3M-1-3]MCP3821446.1 hypothetical protein [Streptomyces sp. A3M-1-3]
MAMNRMNREEFYARLDVLDEARLKKALWAVYWRSAVPVRERIEAETAPVAPAPRRPVTSGPPDPQRVLDEVRGFTALARTGSYMAGDRRVSPRERSGWRFTFRRLAADAQAALAAQECGPAREAVADLVDLAVEVKSYDHFRSEDPMEAAGFVASDVVARLWGRVLELRGVDGLAEQAMEQLVRWESPYGWTRSGWGKVSEKETTLAVVLERLLRDPGAWVECADGYLRALDEVAQTDPGHARASYGSVDYLRKDRARSLAEWNGMLLERLVDYDAADRLDKIAGHPAFAGAEHRLFQAKLARQRGETQRARDLVEEGLAELPGHEELHDLAAQTGAVVPESARAGMARHGL